MGYQRSGYDYRRGRRNAEEARAVEEGLFLLLWQAVEPFGKRVAARFNAGDDG